MTDTVKRWCGRAAAGTETSAMNPMVEAHGDADEDTHYVLASDYEALERLLIERQQDLITRNTELFQARKMLDDEFTRTLRQTSKLSEATLYAELFAGVMRKIQASPARALELATAALTEYSAALAKNPNPPGQSSTEASISGEASGPVGLGPDDKLPCVVACGGGPRFGKGVKVGTLLGYLARRVRYNEQPGSGEVGTVNVEPVPVGVALADGTSDTERLSWLAAQLRDSARGDDAEAYHADEKGDHVNDFFERAIDGSAQPLIALREALDLVMKGEVPE